jgi:hypothetical protein
MPGSVVATEFGPQPRYRAPERRAPRNRPAETPAEPAPAPPDPDPAHAARVKADLSRLQAHDDPDDGGAAYETLTHYFGDDDL